MQLMPKVRQLLYDRGIRGEEELEEYLSPKPRRTYDPFLLKNMRAGVDLIMSSVRAGDMICIYGDYDVDGITSTVILMEMLSRLTSNLMYYIPSRFGEGYGLHRSSLEKIRDKGADLIVTVDCGSVSVDEVAYAKELGLKILVTDHHTVTDKIADCLVINPAQPDDAYPCPYLAGCGVAFKLAQALSAENGMGSEVTTGLLDVLAIGTVADLVPLVDENRTFVKYGLRALNLTRRKCLDRLISAIGFEKGKIVAENISFGLAPHLNAVGRLEHAGAAVELFLSKDPQKIESLVEKMVECNNRRKNLQNQITEECKQMADALYAGDRFLLLTPEHGHEGVAGIVAGKIKEEYYRPTIVFTEDEGLLKGSGRSIPGISIYDELKKNESLFRAFGGHAAACGLTMDKKDLPLLKEALETQMSRLEKEVPDLFEEKKSAELDLGPEDICLELVHQVRMLEPCGMGNTRPVVGVRGSLEGLRSIGNEGQFLRFTVVLDDGSRLPAVSFRNAEGISAVKEERVWLLGALSENVWNGRSTLQFIAEEAVVL